METKRARERERDREREIEKEREIERGGERRVGKENVHTIRTFELNQSVKTAHELEVPVFQSRRVK